MPRNQSVIVMTQSKQGSGGALRYRYDYAYDDGDNMLTKAVYDAVLDTTETTSFTYDAANKLTAQSVGGVNTTFAYDVFGRMASKAQGAYSATYGYHYDHKLRSVASNFPNEGNVTYDYGADGKRRSRVDAAGTTQYRWDAGWNVINEEDVSGLLTRTYIGHTLAHVDGTDPSMGAYKYHFHDHLGSTRRLRAEDRSDVAGYEYTPYGQEYAFTGAAATTNRRYAMLEWDPAAQMHFAPYRYYMPGAGRWNQRDPLGMVDGPNVYGYVTGDPVNFLDPSGRGIYDWFITGKWSPTDEEEHAAYLAFGKWLTTFRLRSGEYECQTYGQCFSECMGATSFPWYGWGAFCLGFGAEEAIQLPRFAYQKWLGKTSRRAVLRYLMTTHETSHPIVRQILRARIAKYGGQWLKYSGKFNRLFLYAAAYDAGRAAACAARCY